LDGFLTVPELHDGEEEVAVVVEEDTEEAHLCYYYVSFLEGEWRRRRAVVADGVQRRAGDASKVPTRLDESPSLSYYEAALDLQL
jgi:hypothetical protein